MLSEIFLLCEKQLLKVYEDDKIAAKGAVKHER